MKSTKRTIAVLMATIMLLSCLFCINVNAAAKKFVDDSGIHISVKINNKSVTSEHSTVAITHTGSAIKPDVDVKYGSKALKKYTDFTVTYKNNTNMGCADVIVKGKGNYTGSVSYSFYITPKSPVVNSYSVASTSISVNWKNASGGKGAYGAVYDANNNLVSSARLEKTDSSNHVLKVAKLTANKKYTLKLKSLYLGDNGYTPAPNTQSIVFYT